MPWREGQALQFDKNMGVELPMVESPTCPRDHKIRNMTFGGWARNVTNAVQAVDRAARVTTDLARRSVEVRTGRPVSVIAATLAKAGYPAVETVERA